LTSAGRDAFNGVKAGLSLRFTKQVDGHQCWQVSISAKSTCHL
jgi:hypothetical protein